MAKYFNRKKIIIATTVIVVTLLFIKRKDMTFRQSFMKTLYGFIMLKGKFFSSAANIKKNEIGVIPSVSIYSLQATLTDGTIINLEQYKGKKIILVNTASDCGYTGQYEDLEALYQQQKSNLVILAFPANDFMQQEKGNDAEIASFCKKNYGVTFPIMKKTSVVKGSNQNKIFAWLSDNKQNGWFNQAPTWNFSKYIVDENGVLQYYFSKDISPLDTTFLAALK